MFSILKYTMAEIEIALHSRMSVFFSIFSSLFFMGQRPADGHYLRQNQCRGDDRLTNESLA